MFKFKPTIKTYSDPISAIFKPGIPFGREYSKGDICLLHDRIPGSKIFFNSKILREALLNSADFLEEALGISIIDKRTKEVEINTEEKSEVKPEVSKPEEPVEEPPVEEPTEEVPIEEAKENISVAEETVPTEDTSAIDALAAELEGKPKKKKTTKK